MTTDPSSRPRADLVRTVLCALFAVVIVVSLGLGVYALASGSDAGGSTGGTSDDPSVREAVMSQADQFVLRSNTYGPGDLDEENRLPGYAEQVREVITPKFAAAFDSSLTLAEQTVAEAGYARDVELYASGVESLADDTATVLVAGVITGSYPDTSAEAEDGDRVEFEPQPFRFKVQLVQTEGEWLVDDFAPLSSEVEDPFDPAVPTEPAPTEPAPTAGTEGRG